MTTIKEIQEKIADSQELLKELESYIKNNFKVEGKSINDIIEYFKVKIPEDINFMTLANTFREISNKYQRATGFRDTQKVKLSILENTQQEKYDEAYQAVREKALEDTGKPLAAKSCEVAAALSTYNLNNTAQVQKVIHDFWDKICKNLVETRKNCEGIIIALSGDAKIQRDFIVKGDIK